MTRTANSIAARGCELSRPSRSADASRAGDVGRDHSLSEGLFTAAQAMAKDAARSGVEWRGGPLLT